MATLNREHPAFLALKGFVVGTSLFVGGSMATTSLQFVPSLILAAEQKDAPGRPKSSRYESGRLTPQPGQDKQLHLSPAAALQGTLSDDIRSAAGGSGYKIAALQFTLMSKTAFATQVPPELLTILSSGFLAYHYRGSGSAVWQKWAAVAALVAAIFPLTGAMMVPIDHKIARIAGEEEKVEPYEDAPPDQDAERTNTEKFLLQWNTLNAVRSGMMLLAGGVGLWSLLD